MIAAHTRFVMVEEAEGSPPLYKQIYDSIRISILKGEYGSGMRLPPSRLLAKQIGVSRMTVINAYEQLFAEGYLTGKQGSGTFVASKLPEEFLRTAVVSHGKSKNRPAEVRLSAYGNYIAKNRSRILKNEGATRFLPFQHGLPAVEEFPFEIWMKISQKHHKYSNKRLLGYGDPAGFRLLREAIASHLMSARGVKCDAGQVIITNGAQQALHLIGSVFLGPGDDVWTEDPGYLGARDVLQSIGANVIPVSIDDEGFDLSAALRKNQRVRHVYLTPSRQFPLGITMSLSRRLSLLEWAAENDGWIIEDDYDSEYRYAGRPLASLQGLDRSGRVLYVGTFSKTIFPGLRLGCLVVPDGLVDVFAAARSLLDLHSPLTDQVVLAEFISDGHYERHLRKMRALYKNRQLILINEIRKAVGDAIEVSETDAGMHLVGWLPKGSSDKRTFEKAAAQNLVVMPISNYYLNKPTRSGLMLGYTAFNEKQIKEGVKVLEKILL